MWFKRKQKSEVETIKVTILKGVDAAPWPNITKQIFIIKDNCEHEWITYGTRGQECKKCGFMHDYS